MAKDFYRYLDLIEETLERVAKPLSADEIWEQANSLGLVSKLRSTSKSSVSTVAAQIYGSIKNEEGSPFIKVGRRPVRFFLRRLADKLSNADLQAQASRPTEARIAPLRERDTHPLLAYFASSQLGVHCRTIFHERSAKALKSEWLHPDVVGLFMPIDDWEDVTLQLSREIGATVAKLYAFELKLEVSFGNLRESFFQAVSNTSWANEGYLAALHFSADPDFQAELKRLSDSFGVGIIRLDAEDPDASEIVYRSRVRAELDWETINRLAEINPDFTTVMQATRDALKIHRINPSDFDKVPEDAETLAAQLAAKPSRSA